MVVEEVRSGEGDWGFDAEIGEYTHLIQAGIIDPVKVTRSALENAGSIAGMMLTTETIITEIPEEKPLARRHAGLHARLGQQLFTHLNITTARTVLLSGPNF